MNSLAASIDALIPIALGVFVTIAGFFTKTERPSWRALRKVKYLGPILILAGVVQLFAGVFGTSSAPDLVQIAAQIRERLGLPAMVDSETRADTVEVIGDRELRFVYTLVNQTSASPGLDELSGRLRALVDGASCTNQDWLTFLRADVAISVRYLTADGTEAMLHRIVPADCGL